MIGVRNARLAGQSMGHPQLAFSPAEILRCDRREVTHNLGLPLVRGIDSNGHRQPLTTDSSPGRNRPEGRVKYLTVDDAADRRCPARLTRSPGQYLTAHYLTRPPLVSVEVDTGRPTQGDSRASLPARPNTEDQRAHAVSARDVEPRPRSGLPLRLANAAHLSYLNAPSECGNERSLRNG